MKSTGTIEINRPIQEVFDYTMTNVAEWSLIVISDEVIEEKPEVVGTTFRTVTEDRGQKMEFEGVVTQNDPPNSQSAIMKGKQFDIDVQYCFEDLGNSTRVTVNSKVDFKGFTKIIMFLIGWMMKKSSCKAQTNELESLKQKCESQNN